MTAKLNSVQSRVQARPESQPKPQISHKPRIEVSTYKHGTNPPKYTKLLHSRSQHSSPTSKKYRKAFTPPANKKKKIWYRKSVGGNPEISQISHLTDKKL